jgi:hypothetical protein
MKARQARKIANRLMTDFRSVNQYKMTTMAAALNRCYRIHVDPKDARVVCGIAHLTSSGILDEYTTPSNLDLAA